MPTSDAKTLEAKLREGANALDEVLSTRELRTYCSYVRRRCHPRLDTKAAVLLQKTYLELRREASLAAPGRAMPITTRQLESLVRLAQARAKIENRSVVTEDDARDVVALMKDSVRDACTGADGNVDFSRQTSGMSAAKAVKKLRDLLHAESERLRSPWFRLDNIMEVARRGGVGGAIDELVDVLRDQSYLMHQRDDEGNWGDPRRPLTFVETATGTPYSPRRLQADVLPLRLGVDDAGVPRAVDAAEPRGAAAVT